MYIIFLLAGIAIIIAITFFKDIKREKGITVKTSQPKKTLHTTELDYLYAYKGILSRMVQMEKDMKGFETTVANYSGPIKTSMLILEPRILKDELNEINIKLKQLMDTYAQGELSLSNISFELDLLEKRLNIVSLLIAA
jgi:hypothetical protein